MEQGWTQSERPVFSTMLLMCWTISQGTFSMETEKLVVAQRLADSCKDSVDKVYLLSEKSESEDDPIKLLTVGKLGFPWFNLMLEIPFALAVVEVTKREFDKLVIPNGWQIIREL